MHGKGHDIRQRPRTNPQLMDSFCRRLAAAGHKLTAPRKAMLGYFLASNPHKTAEDIYLDQRPSGLGRATVFRTLRIFLESGLIVKCAIGGKYGFELAPSSPERHHHHMLCVKCGRIIEFSSPAMEACQEAETRRHGFTPLAHSFEIRGLCRNCNTEKQHDRKTG
ncbi:MAG: Fur family transcriptional regulator [Elusimicrobiaceae bacterium]|nr:Fur family transcriptional regulator [Elusimicrobiaceae bacterium]